MHSQSRCSRRNSRWVAAWSATHDVANQVLYGSNRGGHSAALLLFSAQPLPVVQGVRTAEGTVSEATPPMPLLATVRPPARAMLQSFFADLAPDKQQV